MYDEISVLLIVVGVGVKPLQRLCVEVLSTIVGAVSHDLLPPKLSQTVLDYCIACKEPVPCFKEISLNKFDCVPNA